MRIRVVPGKWIAVRVECVGFMRQLVMNADHMSGDTASGPDVFIERLHLRAVALGALPVVVKTTVDALDHFVPVARHEASNSSALRPLCIALFSEAGRLPLPVHEFPLASLYLIFEG